MEDQEDDCNPEVTNQYIFHLLYQATVVSIEFVLCTNEWVVPRIIRLC